MPIISLLIFILLFDLIIVIIKGRRAEVWLIEVEEEHEDRQEVIPEREETA